MDALLKDVRFALRSLRSHLAFALTAIFTLGLGIGASTAIFSVVNAVILRPLPYAEPDRLMLVWGELRSRDLHDFAFSPPNFQDLKAGAPAFQDLGGVTPFRQALTIDAGKPEQVRAMGVTPNVVKLLGARIALGRDFTAGDAAPPPPPPQQPGQAPNAPPAANVPQPPPPPAMVILNHGFWQRRFGGDASVIGRTFDFGGQDGIVVGVLAPGFEVLFPPNTNVEPHPDMLVAMRIDYATANRNNVFLRVIGRLAPNASVASAQQQADAVATSLREQHQISRTAGLHFHVRPMHEDLVTEVKPAIVALMGAVIFVLLIACSNVANLLLVRAAARERELAVRAALGGSSSRLVRQMLAESLVLAVAGAALGLVLAALGIELLAAIAPPQLPRVDAVALDWRVLGFSALLAVASAAIFGLVPAIRAARPDLAEVLRAAGRSPSLAGGGLLRSGVVAAEVALSFILLVGSGLMLRSFIALANTDPGFDPRGVLTFEVGQRGGRSPDERAAFQRQLAERLRALPGVQNVTAANPLPLDGGLVNARWGTQEALTDPTKFQQTNAHIVLPGYFDAMGTRLIAGRTFTEADNRPDALVVVLDDVIARKAFPNENPVGRRLHIRLRTPEPEVWEVIGVVRHQRHETLVSEGREGVFFADGIFGHGAANRWAVRTNCGSGAACDPAQLAPAVRRIVNELDARLPVAEVQPMTAFVDRAMAPTRFSLVLIAVFAGIAAVLACVGLYGVLATAVRQRTAEIGVRLAFGAPNTSIFRLMIGEGLRLSAIGLVLGVIGALALTGGMRSMLIGVQPTDPGTYAAIVVLFVAIAVLASWLPARRASRVDPAVALKGE